MASNRLDACVVVACAGTVFVSTPANTLRLLAPVQVSLALILNSLPGTSVMGALVLDAIAYAHYVLEYTSGDFAYALKCAEVAGLLLRRLNHEVCMQAASANRVKGASFRPCMTSSASTNNRFRTHRVQRSLTFFADRFLVHAHSLGSCSLISMLHRCCAIVFVAEGGLFDGYVVWLQLVDHTSSAGICSTKQAISLVLVIDQ